jgi:hypothetical protein
VGGCHGQETTQDPRGLHTLPRHHPQGTTYREHGISHWRATCWETSPRGSAGGCAEKDPPPGRHLAAQPTQYGTRHLTVVRLIEICRVLGADAPSLLRQALQRALIYLDSMALRVDLKGLVNSRNEKFRPMVQWARNALKDNPDGVVEVEPAVVKNLALFVGCKHEELAAYLARFLPDDEDAAEEESASNVT